MDPTSDLQRAGLKVYRNEALKATAEKVAGDSLSVRVYGWRIQNLDAAIAYVHLYDKASPTVGTDTPVISIDLAASATDHEVLPVPLEFGTALYVAATTTLGGTTAPTSGELIHLYYRAADNAVL